MTYPLARTAGTPVQQDPLLKEFSGIANKALGESAKQNNRNNTTLINSAIITLEDPKYANLLNTNRSAINSLNGLKRIVNQPELPFPKLQAVVNNLKR